MMTNPIIEWFNKWYQGNKDRGVTYFVWIIFCGGLLGAGIHYRLWPLIITGLVVTMLGMFAYGEIIITRKKHD